MPTASESVTKASSAPHTEPCQVERCGFDSDVAFSTKGDKLTVTFATNASGDEQYCFSHGRQRLNDVLGERYPTGPAR